MEQLTRFSVENIEVKTYLRNTGRKYKLNKPMILKVIWFFFTRRV